MPKLLILLLFLGLAACSTPAVVTQKADLTPIRSSNTAARKEIASTKKSIGAAKESNVKGATSLDEAIHILETLVK